MTNEHLNWVKSSLSDTTACVEWAYDEIEGRVLVRDSKKQDAGTVSFSIEDWRIFVAAVKLGEADL